MLILQNDLQFSGEQDTDKITFMLELTEGIIKCLHFNLLSEYCTVDPLEKTSKLQQTGLYKLLFKENSWQTLCP